MDQKSGLIRVNIQLLAVTHTI